MIDLDDILPSEIRELTGQNISGRELKYAFPDMDDIVKQRVRQLRSSLRERWTPFLQAIEDSPILEESEELFPTHKGFWRVAHKIYMSHDPDHRLLKVYEQYLGTNPINENVWQRNTIDNRLNVDRAKQKPILDLFTPERPRRSAGRTMCNCPFHNDTNASFVIYHNTNTYHCFGCNVSGDSIDLIMQLKDIDFKEAVRQLGG